MHKGHLVGTFAIGSKLARRKDFGLTFLTFCQLLHNISPKEFTYEDQCTTIIHIPAKIHSLNNDYVVITITRWCRHYDHRRIFSCYEELGTQPQSMQAHLRQQRQQKQLRSF